MLRSVEGVVGRGVGWFSIFGEVFFGFLGGWVGDRGCWRRGFERERDGGGGFLKRPGVNVDNT